ncbi:MAG: hypothetical protein HZA50_16945 [Planctomycetes bacterium]|nr:hypothetical protein [Planctomycetota bacterium]
MSVDRPTFSESWYRVCKLRPRLRATVQVRRQQFRGELWHVLEDESSNQFFRLNEPAYRFVARLEGRTTVQEAWEICNEELGDQAATQGEAIQLLGRLYAANLLQADLPPDAEGLLRLQQKRVAREIRGYLTNLLFMRFPLFDPDRLLEGLAGTAGRIFSTWGLVAWLILMAVGLYHIAGQADKLFEQAQGVLAPASLPLLYLSFILVKAFHEFGHALACKKFGHQEGTSGQVHAMGIMLMLLVPMPYVDASSSWALRDKKRRIVIAAAGMIVELAIAAVAAIIWAGTSAGTLHALAYNVIFVAGVSTIVFNVNPLLRYDGYYILSDLLEIPNLYQRGKDSIGYLVKKYVWRIRRARNPAHSRSEQTWLAAYGVGSGIYRVVICVGILWFVTDQLFIVGVLMGLSAVAAWVVVPLGKGIHYLAASAELFRRRWLAVGSTLAAAAVVVVLIGLIPFSDRSVIEGVVEPVDVKILHADGDGFLTDFLPGGGLVERGAELVNTDNPAMRSDYAILRARQAEYQARYDQVAGSDPAAASVMAEQVRANTQSLKLAARRLDALRIAAPVGGLWISPELGQIRGAFLKRGQAVGMVVSPDRPIIRAAAGQDVAGMLTDYHAAEVQIRPRGRPDVKIDGKILRILPAGQEELPSEALGYSAGGGVQTEQENPRKAMERIFEIRIEPAETNDFPLMAGQRVYIRLDMGKRPLLAQWWRAVMQVFQRKVGL